MLNGEFDKIPKNNIYLISHYLYELFVLKYNFNNLKVGDSGSNNQTNESQPISSKQEKSSNKEIFVSSNEVLNFIEMQQKEEPININFQTKNIQTIYSQFKFFGVNKSPERIIKKQIYFEYYVLNYVKDFKFFTYQITPNNDANHESNTNVNAYICVEGKCLIIENIKISFINQIIQKMGKYGSVLNVNDDNINDMVLKFYSYFEEDIKENLFVQKTLKLISCFLIRRFFYPTSFFKNKKFFYNNNPVKYREDLHKAKIINFMDLDHYFNPEEFLELIIDLKNNYIHNESFELSEFIVLRKIYRSNKASFYLAFHIEKLYIFCLIIPHDRMSINEFSMAQSHRYFTCFYGFLQDKKENIGFVYEYMCNNTFESFLLSNEHISNKYYMINICRIFQGIQYLHLKNFVYDDLKLSNILLDNNIIPYICDFDTTHKINEEKWNEAFYSDFISFGKIIYRIFEKNKKCIEKKQNDEINSFNTLYDIYFNISESKKSMEEFFSCFLRELYLNSSKYFTVSITKDSEIIQFLLELMNILPSYDQQLSKFYNYIAEIKNKLKKVSSQNNQLQNKSIFIKILSEQNYSELLYILGPIYQQAKEPNIFKSIEYYELAAQNNHAKALYKLGDFYYYGFLGSENCSKCIEYYELAAKNQNSNALFMLGEIYLNGKIVQMNCPKAIEYYELSAQYLNPKALYKLGIFYYYGNFVEQNYTKARFNFEFLTIINNSNDDEQYTIYKSYAFFYLGEIYQHGYDSVTDFSAAIKYYELSAKYNNPVAFYTLGYMHEKGIGISKSFDKSKKFYEQVVQCKSNDFHEILSNKESIKNIKLKSLYRLGKLYQKSRITKDYQQSIKYFTQAAQQGFPKAFNRLGIAYFDGYGVPKNYVKSIEYFELALNKGCLKAALSLGKIYELGKGVEKNMKKSIEYLCIYDNLESYDLCFIGCMYEEGVDVQQNYNKAKEYYEKAAAYKNDPEAFICLGFLYENGYGVEKNMNLARSYYIQGEEICPIMLVNYGLLYEFGEYIQDNYTHIRKQNYYKSKIFYEYASKNEIPNSFYFLGNLYVKGFGVEAKDYLKAKELFEKDALLDGNDGLIGLGSLYFYGLGVEKDYEKAFLFYSVVKKFVTFL